MSVVCGLYANQNISDTFQRAVQSELDLSNWVDPRRARHFQSKSSRKRFYRKNPNRESGKAVKTRIQESRQSQPGPLLFHGSARFLNEQVNQRHFQTERGSENKISKVAPYSVPQPYVVVKDIQRRATSLVTDKSTLCSPSWYFSCSPVWAFGR